MGSRPIPEATPADTMPAEGVLAAQEAVDAAGVAGYTFRLGNDSSRAGFLTPVLLPSVVYTVAPPPVPDWPKPPPK